jgi:hypothetical protein
MAELTRINQRREPLLPSEKGRQQVAGRLGLLLLNPVAGAGDKVNILHPRKGVLLHSLQRPRPLMGTPVLVTGNKAGRQVDGPSAE